MMEEIGDSVASGSRPRRERPATRCASSWSFPPGTGNLPFFWLMTPPCTRRAFNPPCSCSCRDRTGEGRRARPPRSTPRSLNPPNPDKRASYIYLDTACILLSSACTRAAKSPGEQRASGRGRSDRCLPRNNRTDDQSRGQSDTHNWSMGRLLVAQFVPGNLNIGISLPLLRSEPAVIS